MSALPHQGQLKQNCLCFDMEEKLLTVLLQSPHSAFSTLQLAKSVGCGTRSAVNPSLYALQAAGKVEQVNKAPPMWRILLPSTGASHSDPSHQDNAADCAVSWCEASVGDSGHLQSKEPITGSSARAVQKASDFQQSASPAPLDIAAGESPPCSGSPGVITSTAALGQTDCNDTVHVDCDHASDSVTDPQSAAHQDASASPACTGTETCDLEAEAMRFIAGKLSPCSTLEIGKAIGLGTRSQVTPVLVCLEQQGKIVRTQLTPAMWAMAPSPPLTSTALSKGNNSAAAQPVSAGLSTPPDSLSALKQRIVALMREETGCHSSLQIAHAVGLKTRAQVNPTLFQLKDAGLINQVQSQPPMWQVNASADALPSSGNDVSFSAAEFQKRNEGEVLKFLCGQSKPCSTLEIGQAIGIGSRAGVNPMLLSMVERGLIHKSQNMPPLWVAVSKSHVPPSTAPPGSSHEARSDDVVRYLSAQHKPCSSLEIGCAIGISTRQEVTPILEGMRTLGLLVKTQEMPALWMLGNDGEPAAKRPALSPPERLSRTLPPPRPVMGNASAPTLRPLPQSNATRGLLPSAPLASASNQNPVGAVMEYAQAHSISAVFTDGQGHGQGHRQKFTVAAVLGNQRFNGTATNKKDAKRLAAEAALLAIRSGQVGTEHPDSSPHPFVASQPTAPWHGPVPLAHPTAAPSSSGTAKARSYGSADVSKGMPQRLLSARGAHPDMLAQMSHQHLDQLALTCAASHSGRKALASFVLVKEDEEATVVALGTGMQCITNEHMSCEGLAVNDMHAEIVARRSLLRYLYSQVLAFHSGCNTTCLEPSSRRGVLKLKRSMSLHLYISHVPCGDGAVFSPSGDQPASSQNVASTDHRPTFDSKHQGVLRTKVSETRCCKECISCQGISDMTNKIVHQSRRLQPGSHKITPSWHLSKCTAAASIL